MCICFYSIIMRHILFAHIVYSIQLGYAEYLNIIVMEGEVAKSLKCFCEGSKVVGIRVKVKL